MAALDAGVPLRDVQTAARHADPRTTTIYDHRRENFDRHAAYVGSHSSPAAEVLRRGLSAHGGCAGAIPDSTFGAGAHKVTFVPIA